MKNIINIFLLFLAVFAFNSCSEEIEGTEDLNFASFNENSFSITVNKNSTAEKEVKVYTTQIMGSDRTLAINVNTDLTSADKAAYSVPESVTIPANSNEGVFSVTILDENISSDGETLVISLVSEEGLYTGDNLNINVQRFCPLVIEDFLGDYIISEAGYGDYATTITLDESVENRIWVTNFWDWTNDLVYYDFDPGNGTIVMPSQVVTMGDGNDYTVVGNGTYNACNGTFHMEYEGDVAGTIHDFYPAPAE
mgnify:CR=1 FL=1